MLVLECRNSCAYAAPWVKLSLATRNSLSAPVGLSDEKVEVWFGLLRRKRACE